MNIEMTVPAKYKADIDWLRNGHHGWHRFRHRLAWALMPECIRALTIAGLMCILHPDEVMNALFEKSLIEYADLAARAEADEEPTDDIQHHPLHLRLVRRMRQKRLQRRSHDPHQRIDVQGT